MLIALPKDQVDAYYISRYARLPFENGSNVLSSSLGVRLKPLIRPELSGMAESVSSMW